MQNNYYVAYPSSDQLKYEARRFISSMREATPTTNLEPLVTTLRLLVNETVDVYLFDFFQYSEPNGIKKKLLELAEGTVKGTASAVIKQVAKSLDIHQQVRVAEHIDSCLLPLHRDNMAVIEWVVCPISDTTFRSLTFSHAAFHDVKIDQARNIVLQRQKILFDKMVEYIIERMITIIQLGLINRKIVRAAVDQSVGVMHSTFEKIIAKMEREELEHAARRINEMLLTHCSTAPSMKMPMPEIFVIDKI